MNRQRVRLYAFGLMLVLLFLVGCAAPPTPIAPTATAVPPTPISPTTISTPIPPTPTPISPTTTSTPIPPTPIPTSTPTVEPAIRQTKIEIVTNNAVTGDGGNSWGGHQTRIVHTQDGIFTAYTIEGGGYLKREWRLVQRQTDGTWAVVAKGESGREPVNLLASPDGTLNIIGWPNGQATLWSGKPKNGTLAMTTTRIPNQLNGNWPYNSAGIDESGDLCVLSSDGGEKPVGRFYWACYIPSKGEWVTQTNTLDFRFCYTYVFPDPSGGLSLLSTRDVRWEAMGYQKPGGQFDYVFNAFGLWRTGDISKKPLERVFFLEEKPTTQYPAPVLNAQEDAYLDTKGQMHVIYHVQGESTHGAWISHHAIISPDGAVLYDAPLPKAAGDYSRIFQDQKGRFYLLGSSGLLYPLGMDGISTDKSIALDLGGNRVEYSGFGVSVPRTGTPLSNVIDVVFPSAGGTKWLYFQLDFSIW